MSGAHPPRARAESFDCPHCGAYTQQTWAECYAKSDDSGDSFDPELLVSTCFGCRGEAVWKLNPRRAESPSWVRGAQIIHPAVEHAGPLRSADMPTDVAELYDEASTVMNLSPRSASALLRLALEVLLEGLYPQAGKLNDMIGAAVEDGLPTKVQQTMDYIRFNGNQSVHKFHHDDTVETASILFSLLNIVVEHLITQPKQLASLYAELPQTFRDQVGRRDSTSKTP